jgi:hypothetical protein
VGFSINTDSGVAMQVLVLAKGSRADVVGAAAAGSVAGDRVGKH